MIKKYIYIVSALLLLASCAPKQEEEIVQKSDEKVEQEISIVPGYRLAKENYKMLLPFRPSKARGVIVGQVANRLDINEMEEGLRRHSTKVFDPEKYYFEEGQYLTEDTVIGWIDGFNPDRPEQGSAEKEFRDNPRYLSHVLEQNYLKKTENNSVELVGVSIGLALKSMYSFTTEAGGPTLYKKIPKEEMLSEGKKISEKVLKELREIDELKDVPIMIALYREEEQASPVPGNFVASTNIPSGSMELGDWTSLNENYVLFPSDEARNNHYDDYELVNSFGKDIAKYFPNYVGVIGEGFYENKELKKLSIEIPIQFYGGSEVIGFTQYTYGIVKEMFPNYYDLEIKVMSNGKLESLIYQEAGKDEPTVHVLY